MPHPVSTLGAIHTAVSVATFVAGLYSYARHHQIEPRAPVARGYLLGMLVSVLTAFGLSSTGGFNVGHALGILALLVVGAALVIPKLRLLGRARPYLAHGAAGIRIQLLPAAGTRDQRNPDATAKRPAIGGRPRVAAGAGCVGRMVGDFRGRRSGTGLLDQVAAPQGTTALIAEATAQPL